MKILVLGADGYTGFPLSVNLAYEGHDVVGSDNLMRRILSDKSVTPIESPRRRMEAAGIESRPLDITDRKRLKWLLEDRDFDAIANLAQIPSAPYSMVDADTAWKAQRNNILGSLNLYWIIKELDLDVHVVQLATMGEYGTPDQPIPEGFLEDGRPAPKEPGSFYHCSKANTTTNTLFASRNWGIPTTEIYQGIVYGVSVFEDMDERLLTRFDVDEVWGTVVNRFTAQAVTGHPLTVYGEGGQERAMLSIKDCVQCLTLALENPPDPGTDDYPYRAINQFDDSYRVRELAEWFNELYDAEIKHVENPRNEDDTDHYYEPEREKLEELGYEPTQPLRDEVEETARIVEEYADRVPDDLSPETEWD